MRPFPHVGLILTGGGARGAYQAGALRAVTEITHEMGISQPFTIFSGTSAGAINAALLAAHADQMQIGAEKLTALWHDISTEQIFRTDFGSLSRTGLRWVLELFSGGAARQNVAHGLLDTAPLRELITREINFSDITKNIDNKLIKSLIITATNYTNGICHNFFEMKGEVKPWLRARRVGDRTEITPDHVMASSAIPVFFPPIKIEEDYFGDGSLRNYTPFSPAIRLGAEKVLVIPVRKQDIAGDEEEQSHPTIGRVISVILNSVLLDAVDMDYERLTRINQTLGNLRSDAETPLRPIDVCMIRPSQDIGKIAFEEEKHMPRTLRYMIRGLGSSKDAEGLISYLLFESSFTRRLLDLGYADAMAMKDEITNFYRV